MHSPTRPLQWRPLLRRWLAELLECVPEAIDDHTRFRELGLSSLQMQSLAARVSEHLGSAISATAVWEHPTVAALSAHLSAEKSSRPALRPSAQVQEPIAIVGMGCRFPGGVHDPASLWAALESGADGVIEVPEERWDLRQWFDPDAGAPGKMSTRWAGLLHDVSGFDAAFFRISPKEAAQIDPQQRLSLEVAWEALEDAGIVPGALDGSRTGVFIGAWSQDYAELAALDAQGIEPHSATGWNNSIIPARIAYALGLRGPVLTVNTACSSSLVAVHLAMQALRNGECELALAGGVNVLLSPQTTVQMTKFGGMSPSGRCRSFAANADGYVRAEGCGVVVLRRLSEAVHAGERIYAILRGSAVNNDGASNGLTAPNPEAQREVLTDAWRNAGVAVHEVSYVEAHGTGTPIGDPIEAFALGSALGAGRKEPLRVGSIKSNLGHLEGAAGIAGLVKVALSLHHGLLPANLHFERPSPLIDFQALRLEVVEKAQSFPGDGARHAGVSSFGYGGTNGHLALSEAPSRRQTLLPLAAASETELRVSCERLSEEVAAAQGDDALQATALRHQRGALRAVVRGRHPHTLRRALREIAEGRASPSFHERPPRIVFVFSGHGSQWLGMGRDLLASEPTFARALRECDRYIQSEGGWSLLDALCAADATSRLERTDVLQPALFAIQVALARTLQSWGIEPSAVLGQSVGEVAAAVVAGALSEQDGAKVIVRWSALVAREVSGRGAMIVAPLGAAEAQDALTRAAARGVDTERISVSGHLAPRSVSFAGELRAIDAFEKVLAEQGVRVHRVAIDYACHSVEMAAITAPLRACLAGIASGPLSIPMWSTVHSRFIAGEELDAEYWAQNLTRPIELSRGVAALAEDGGYFLDLGPHPIALQSIVSTLEQHAAENAVALATSFRHEPAWRALEDLAATLWQAGASFDWAAFYGLTRTPDPHSAALPLLLSGQSEVALRTQAGRWAAWLEAHPEVPWVNVARAAAAHRSQLPVRAAIRAADRPEQVEALRALENGRPHVNLVQADHRQLAKVAFVFSGQGGQWPAMGKALLEQSLCFAKAVRACDAALRPYVGWSVLSVLRGDEGAPALDRVDVVQPALFTMSVGLAAVWRGFGVEPAAVVGHSQGEIAAAVVCGALSLEEGARVVALRSQLLERLADTGAMATVELPVREVEERLRDPRWSDLHVAVVNTASSTAIAGAPNQVEAWVEALTEEGIFCRRVAVGYASHSPHVDPILEPLKAALACVEPRASTIPMVSSVTGEPIHGDALDADYWCRNLREPVRLDRALAHLRSTDHDVWIEVSAHSVLAMALAAAAEPASVVVGSLRRDAGGLDVLYGNLAALHVHGYEVDWARLVGTGPRAALPTYPFQHQRYWLPSAMARGDASKTGLVSVRHPWLRSVTSVAESGQLLLTGRIDLAEHAWLTGHAVFESVVLPGTALLELALRAARIAGSAAIAELTLAAPLLLSEVRGAVSVQIQIEKPDAHGRRALALFSRGESAPEDDPWTRHASGALLHDSDLPRVSEPTPVWPPQGAQALDLHDLHSQLEKLGYGYGEAFRGLRAAWTKGDELFAQVVLSGTADDSFGVHPALLDSALHVVLASFEMREGGPIWLPFTWTRVAQHAPCGNELWVRFVPNVDADDRRSVSLTAYDRTGRVVLDAEALSFRHAAPEQVRAAAQQLDQDRDLYEVRWSGTSLDDALASCHVLGPAGGLAEILAAVRHASSAELIASLDREVPAVLLIDATTPRCTWDEATLLREVHGAAVNRLAELQALLSEPRLASTAFVWATRRAVATGEDGHGPFDPIAAPLWGLVRSARSENPERTLRLVDLDESHPSKRTLQRLVATASEPELALRDGQGLVPRLRSVHAERADELVALSGTVLVTGGLGELGQSLALHLVRGHGAKHLILTSRTGPEHPDAHALTASLRNAGAESVEVVACDIAERDQLARLIASVPSDRPLCGVFHLAGVLEDGITVRLSTAQLERVLRPKVDGALLLHELTAGHSLVRFVMFSSVAGVVGLQGQANYAAANAFMDVLIAERRRRGLPGQSLAWGLWEQQGIGMSAHLREAEIARIARQGVAALPIDRGLALLDRGLLRPQAMLLPAHLDLDALTRACPRASDVPVMFRSLLRRAAPNALEAGAAPFGASVRARLSALPEAEAKTALLGLVRDEIASTLGASATEVGARAPLKQLGLDSLMAVDLRNRLSRRFEVSLPATLAFDYPTPTAIADVLWAKLDFAPARDWNDAEVRGKLGRICIRALRASGVLDVLMKQPDEDRASHLPMVASETEVDIDGLEHDSLLAKMEEMLGVDDGG